MRTNSKEFNALMYPYILDAIEDEYYSNSDTEKLQFLANSFKDEYCYPENLRRYKTYQEVLRQWIMGLPSAFSIDYENYRILEIAKQRGSIPENATAKQEDTILKNWFNLVAFKTLQLFKKHNINL